MVGHNHFSDITTGHIYTLQFSVGIADGIDGRVVVHLLVSQSEFFRMVDGVVIMAEVHNARGTRIGHGLDIQIGKDGIVLQQELVNDKVAVFHAKDLTGTLVNVAQHTLVVVIHDVNK